MNVEPYLEATERHMKAAGEFMNKLLIARVEIARLTKRIAGAEKLVGAYITDMQILGQEETKTYRYARAWMDDATTYQSQPTPTDDRGSSLCSENR